MNLSTCKPSHKNKQQTVRVDHATPLFDDGKER
jgi:hypothetical protein